MEIPTSPLPLSALICKGFAVHGVNSEEVGFVDLLTGIHQLVVWPVDLQHSQGALVERAEEGMIHELELELHNGRATGWDQRRLHIFLPYRCATFSVDPVKNLSNDVKRRHQVWPAIPNEEADGFANVRLQGIVATRELTAPLNTTYVGRSSMAFSMSKGCNPSAPWRHLV